MPTKFERLQSLLAELFQLDRADLDFGIYRIMNLRRGEITRFLNQELLPQVRTALAGQGNAGRGEIQAELRQVEQQAQALGVDPNAVPKVQQLRERLAAYGADPATLEDDVYSHLYDFFRRYYDEGDFISMRRYKEGVYAIPYEGEEVKLHWANADQYYVKTSENFRDYAFRLPSGRRVHFKLAEAEADRDNVKAAGKDRRFMLGTGEQGLGTGSTVVVKGDELVIRFEYRADPEKRKQTELNGLASAMILAAAPVDWTAELAKAMPTEANPRRTTLDKQLADYTARNTFDYFIHKDLRGFLRRELDFYIKNEVVRLDDIESETAPRVEAYLGKVRALRQVGHKIIDFLAQIEELQKRLWLKKKFVVATNYCVTLDRVPEALYPEIAANDAQRAEWVRLFAIDEIAESTVTPGYAVPLTVAFLKANPFLVLDTKFFDGPFRNRLVGSFDDLDAETDGLLVHSENFQALRLLMTRYRGQVHSIYIDPPYNTGPSEILYKNSYRDSSWLSLMHARIDLSLPLLQERACYAIAIDDFELAHLCEIADQLFVGYDRNMVVVNHHPQGGMSHNISRTHEYMLMMTPGDVDVLRGKQKSGEVEQRSFMLSGPGDNKSRRGRPNSFYAILIDEERMKIVGLEPSPALGAKYPTSKTPEGYIRRYPISPTGEEKVWCRSYDSALAGLKNGEIVLTENGTLKLAVDTANKRYSLMSNWTDSKYNAGPHGTGLVAEIIGDREAFSYPKSLYTVADSIEAMTWQFDTPTVMDYFAGSATTGHAVVSLNRQDGGARKYILVEMEQYFDAVTKPRMERIIYSTDWKDGKPVSRAGSSHLFKYLRLESYEDTLNNLAFGLRPGAQLALAGSDAFREDYTLHYMLDAESRDSLLNVRAFEDPFAYTLNVATGTVGETRPVAVDMVETFNYLLGLRVRHVDAIQGYRVVQGLNSQGERVLVIWRNLKEKTNADLEMFFRKQDYNPRDMEFDLIYVNGDNHLENLRRPDETWKVRLIEEEFMRLMFDVGDV